jgi:hypothetical protein
LPHDDHPSPPKLLDKLEAVLEHHQADDHRDPHDAACDDYLAYVRKHRRVLDYCDVNIADGSRFTFDGGVDDSLIIGDRDGVEFDIPLDPPSDRQR